MKSKVLSVLAVIALSGAMVRTAVAVQITPGFTFSVADAYTGPAGQGTHYHSNTGGSFGNPAGLAEVGRLGVSGEEIRGLSEYNLTGLSASPSAFVTFEVYELGGLFGQSFGTFNITINAYLGNNTENLSDWQAASTGFVGTFSTAGLSVGDTVSFDITSIYNAAISGGDASLGIRLAQNPLLAPNQAVVFNNFRLTTDDQSSNRVPDGGSTLLLLSSALGAIVVLKRRFVI